MFDNRNPTNGAGKSRLVIEESDLAAQDSAETAVLPPDQPRRRFTRPGENDHGQPAGGNGHPASGNGDAGPANGGAPVLLKKQPVAPVPVVAPARKLRPQPEPTAAEVAAMGGGPLGPGAPEPEQGWFRNNSGKILAASAAVVALAVGFIVAFVVLDVFSTDKAKVTDALSASEESFRGPVDAALAAENERQDRLPAINEAGADANDQAGTIRSEADALRADVKDGAIANPALDLMEAEERFMLEYAKVEELDEKSLSDWKRIRPGMERARADILAASKSVETLQLESSAALTPDAKVIDDAIAAIDEIVVNAGKEFKRWRKERAAAESQRSVLTSYRGRMAGLIEQYYDQRDVTRAFTRQQGTTYNEASETLVQHSEQRQAIINGMNALQPPPAAQSAHAAMVQLCMESRQILVDAAGEAQEDQLAEYDFFADEEDTSSGEWPGSPGYERMMSRSDAITSQFDPRKNAVLGATDRAIAAVKIPPKPRP